MAHGIYLLKEKPRTANFWVVFAAVFTAVAFL